MAKQKPVVEIRSFGIYTKWDSGSKELPRVVEFTRAVPAEIDIEFGIVANIKRAKNQVIDYCIYHPGILDADGRERPPFDGQVYAKTNDWDFFLGDTIWNPIDDKIGPWRMTIAIDGALVADETLSVVVSKTLG